MYTVITPKVFLNNPGKLLNKIEYHYRVIDKYSNGRQFGYKAKTSSKFHEYAIQKLKDIEIKCQI